jgi:uncharacterized lipoprotein
MYKTAILFLALISGSTMLCAQQKVATAVDGVELQSEGSLYWLQFDKDADALWPMLKDFWSNEGITLKKENPVLGFMETDWTKDLLVERFLSVLLSEQAPTRRERFRLRVERLPDNKGTRVFINHSAYGILYDEEATYTGYLPASPQLEIEMLSRLARYSGVSADQADQMVSSFSVHELKAERISADRYDISVPGSLDFVRKKLIRVLDRMDAVTGTETARKLVATFNKTPDYVDQNAGWDIDDNSDLEETGFDDYTASALDKDRPQKLTYQFDLTEKNTSVVISISSAPDNTDNGIGLSRFSQTLAKKLQAK